MATLFIRQVQENRAATPLSAGADIPAELEHDIIDMVRSPHVLVACGEGKHHKAIVSAMAGCIAPAVVLAQRYERNEARGPAPTIGPVESADGVQRCGGGAIVTLTLGEHDPALANAAGQHHVADAKPSNMKAMRAQSAMHSDSGNALTQGFVPLPVPPGTNCAEALNLNPSLP